VSIERNSKNTTKLFTNEYDMDKFFWATLRHLVILLHHPVLPRHTAFGRVEEGAENLPDITDVS